MSGARVACVVLVQDRFLQHDAELNLEKRDGVDVVRTSGWAENHTDNNKKKITKPRKKKDADAQTSPPKTNGAANNATAGAITGKGPIDSQRTKSSAEGAAGHGAKSRRHKQLLAAGNAPTPRHPSTLPGPPHVEGDADPLDHVAQMAEMIEARVQAAGGTLAERAALWGTLSQSTLGVEDQALVHDGTKLVHAGSGMLAFALPPNVTLVNTLGTAPVKSTRCM